MATDEERRGDVKYEPSRWDAVLKKLRAANGKSCDLNARLLRGDPTLPPEDAEKFWRRMCDKTTLRALPPSGEEKDGAA